MVEICRLEVGVFPVVNKEISCMTTDDWVFEAGLHGSTTHLLALRQILKILINGQKYCDCYVHGCLQAVLYRQCFLLSANKRYTSLHSFRLFCFYFCLQSLASNTLSSYMLVSVVLFSVGLSMDLFAVRCFF